MFGLGANRLHGDPIDLADTRALIKKVKKAASRHAHRLWQQRCTMHVASDTHVLCCVTNDELSYDTGELVDFCY